MHRRSPGFHMQFIFSILWSHQDFIVSVIQPQQLAYLLFLHSELLIFDSILSLLSEETNSRADFSALFTLAKAKAMKIFCSKIHELH